MRITLLTAVILGIFSLPLYAQAPDPMEEDTSMQMTEPEAAGEEQEMQEPAMAGNLTLQDMAFCDSIADREPVSPDSTFSAEAGKIYCWSNVQNDGGETFIEHVWLYKGEEMARVSLPAKYSRNRVWSSKTILPEWTGAWTVKVMAGSEQLGEMTCTVE